MINSIEVLDLSKKYGSFEAVKHISFNVKEGSLFAFLGTNGAGKSTTIDILCTLHTKTAGTVTINEHVLGDRKQNHQIRKDIGVVFQQNLLDDRLTVYENIQHRGSFYGLTRKQLKENYAFVSQYLHLDDIAHRKYGKLSGGQKRRADIARALIHKPTILFLDEPTTGLDPKTRVFVWDAIKKLQQDTNMTVFLTTHYMEEATFADKIVVIKAGEIVAQGTPIELKEQYAYDHLTLQFHEGEDGAAYLREQSIPFLEKNNIYSIRVNSSLEALDILKKIESHLHSFEVRKGSLDDVFLRINEEGVTIA